MIGGDYVRVDAMRRRGDPDPLTAGIVHLPGTGIVAWSDGHRHALALVMTDGPAVALRWGAWKEIEVTTTTITTTETPTIKKRRRRRASDLGTLTPQEVATMWRIVLGESNKEIAVALGIAAHTAKFHVRNAVRRLGCSRRDAAVLRFVFLSRENLERARRLARGDVAELAAVA